MAKAEQMMAMVQAMGGHQLDLSIERAVCAVLLSRPGKLEEVEGEGPEVGGGAGQAARPCLR